MNSSEKDKKTSARTVLVNACAKNLSLDLRIEADKPPAVYRSRFLSIDKRSSEAVLLIEAPVIKGHIAPVRPGRKVRVAFKLNDHENYFETTVLDRGRYQLNPQVSVAILELRMPEEIAFEQTRAFYRVNIDESESFEVKIAILAVDEGGAERIRWRERGILTDISGGGLGFRISEGKSLLIKAGTRLLLKFALPPDKKEIKLKGQVCFSLRQPELREAFFGVQFIDIGSDLEYKRNVDKILHFVAEEQRRALGERTHSRK